MTNFFILAGGYGKRAKPLTGILPKPLFPLAGEPLLKIISSQLIRNGLKRGFINTHHLGEKIKNYHLPNLNITFFEENTLSGNKILSSCQAQTDSDLLVINGDTFLYIPYKNLFKELQNSKADGVLLVRKNDGIYSSIVTKEKDFVRRDKDPLATDIMYTGVAIFRKELLSRLSEENLFDSLESSGAGISVLRYEGLWLDLGTPGNYFLSERTFRKYSDKGDGNSLSENVTIEEGAKVDNSIIWDNTRVGNGVIVRDSVITGNLNINEGNFFRKIITENGMFDLEI